jgi:hypothetical protein
MLAQELAKNRDLILERWTTLVLDGYPEETAKFLRDQPDRFANPVGAGLREGLAELVDGIIRGAEPGELTTALDGVIRVRAVQDFSAPAAVGFIFDLKGVVRGLSGIGGTESNGWLASLDERIDRLGLQAFDVYTRCREQMWAIRAREIRNQSVGIMERVAEWRDRRDRNPKTKVES